MVAGYRYTDRQQVRAGGLAEGYLGSDELNKQKFIPNFFRNNDDLLALDLKLAQVRRHLEPWRAHYKGPRDRMLFLFSINPQS